jgi:thiamine-phosphate pyrophosphorylase
MLERGVYAILDLGVLGPRDPLALATSLLEAGVVALQLRAKGQPPDALEPLARDLLARCRAAGVPFVVNDHVELARQIGADAVHLGQTDLPVAEARQRLGPGIRIGRSTHTVAQARSAAAEGADYLGFGPIFPTTTKPDAEPVQGLARLAEVCAALDRPVVAIGGIDLASAPAVGRTGARSLAVIGAVLRAPDPAMAARSLAEAFRSGESRQSSVDSRQSEDQESSD